MSGWWSGVARRLRAAGPLAGDVALTVAVVVVALAQLLAQPPGGYRPADLLGAVLLAALCAPLALRSRGSRRALVAVHLPAAAYILLGYPQVALGIPLVVAVYSVGARHGLRASAGVLVLVAALLGVAFTADPQHPGAVDLLVTVVSLAGAWWVGASIRIRRDQAALVEERAALLERARRDEADRAVALERLRIARELHDVVAHSLSVVAVQSGMAEHLLATQPERAHAALAAISATSRSALGELRRLLGVLRDDDEPASSLTPQLGIVDLPALVERVRDAGVTVELTTTGDPGSVPAAAALTAYRIVQEALTNAVRHAGPGTIARVTVSCRPATVDVLVVDDGRSGPSPVPGDRRGSAARGAVRSEPERVAGRRGPPSGRAGEEAGPADRGGLPGAGVGLIGMRERVEVFGGDLEAGPVPRGGWRVAARLPLARRMGDAT